MGTAPELCAPDAPVKELASKDTNSNQLELNNNNQQHDSGNDSMTDQQEQTSHGICSQATQTTVDLTESDPSDGMLLDGLRTINFAEKTREEAGKECFERAKEQGTH